MNLPSSKELSNDEKDNLLIQKLYKQKITMGTALPSKFKEIIDSGVIAEEIENELEGDAEAALKERGLNEEGYRLFEVKEKKGTRPTAAETEVLTRF